MGNEIYHAVLELSLSKDSFRPLLQHKFSTGGYAVATDSFSMVYIPEILVTGVKSMDEINSKLLVEGTIPGTSKKFAESIAKLIDVENNSNKYFEYSELKRIRENRNVFEDKNEGKYYNIALLDHVFEFKLINRLRKIALLLHSDTIKIIHYLDDRITAVVFQIGEVRIALMPIRDEEYSDTIDVKELENGE
jgi:hypothetical protein